MVEITDKNFTDYFFDVRRFDMQKGQVLCKFTAFAELVPGFEKHNMIKMLKNYDKAVAATQVMRNCFCSSERDSYKVPKEIIKDLLSGMTDKEVEEKPYEFLMEMLFYADPNHVPKDNPHWSVVSELNIDEILAARDPRIKTKIDWGNKDGLDAGDDQTVPPTDNA